MYNHCVSCIKKLTILLLLAFVFTFPFIANAYEFDKNLVIVSYDVSGTMDTPRYVPKSVHERVKVYLKYILGIENGGNKIENSTGWRKNYLTNSNDSEVVSLPSDHWLAKKGLLANNSGCIFVSFGDNIRKLASYDVNTPKNNIDLNYPTTFKDQNTIFQDLLNEVSNVANYSAQQQVNCYWVSVTDNIEDTNGVGGGKSNEAFNRFCSEKYYKPVLSIKLSIPKKDNTLKKDWQVYVNVSHIADLSIAIKDYSDSYTSLDSELNTLSQNKLISDSNDFIDCKYKLKDLKLNSDILKNNPTDINTANKIETCIAELREKIKNLRILLNKNEAYGDKIQSLKNEFAKFREEFGNSDRLDSIEKDLIRVDENLSKMESAEISNALSTVEKDFNELKRTTVINFDANKKEKELIQREKAALEPVKNKYLTIDQKNKSLGQLATRTADLEAIGTILKQLENTIPNKDETDFNNTLTSQNSKLDEIEPLIGYASKPNEYQRLLDYEKKLKEILDNPSVKPEIKEDLQKQLNNIKNNFNNLSSDELDKQLRKFYNDILSQGSGSNALGFVLILVLAIAVIFLFIQFFTKPYSIIIKSRANDDDDWENPKEYYITTRKDSNRISFSENGKGMVYQFITSDYSIERRGSKLYLVKGKTAKPITFGMINRLSDSDSQFIVEMAGARKRKVTKASHTFTTTENTNSGDDIDF